MRLTKSIPLFGVPTGKAILVNTSAHSPLWSNVRFASPPGSKEYRI